MATHQDYWKKNGGKKEAIKWLKSLKQGDELLHPPPKVMYNLAKPTGKNFEIVTVKSIHNKKDEKDPHIIVSFSDMPSNWDRRLPFKYAFAGSVNA